MNYPKVELAWYEILQGAMTGVLREIAQKKIKIVLFSNFYELFENNHRIYRLFRPHSKSYIWFFLNIDFLSFSLT